MERIEHKSWEGDGLKLVYDEGDWVIGIKNYKVANDIENLKELERHLLTDESFVLLKGNCLLVAKDESDESMTFNRMEEGKVYTISKGIWHTTIMEKGCKMILIERSSTSMENSELYPLTEEEISSIRAYLR
ncbi:MAG: hypothetical protein ACPKOP_04310 [Sphaerochaetaceae bacterium]